MPEIATGLTIGATLLGSAIQGDAAGDAADTQAAAATAGEAGINRRFDALQALLKPYTEAGVGALGQQQALLGLSGPGAQNTAISALEKSPLFAALTRQGENAILQNASATGGLRGGNTQGVLAQFRPQMLQSLIDKQYGNLAGLTSIGQNAAAGTGNAGMQAGVNIAELLQQQGAAQAGGILGQSNALAGGIGNISGILASLFKPGAGSANAGLTL